MQVVHAFEGLLDLFQLHDVYLDILLLLLLLGLVQQFASTTDIEVLFLSGGLPLALLVESFLLLVYLLEVADVLA